MSAPSAEAYAIAQRAAGAEATHTDPAEFPR